MPTPIDPRGQDNPSTYFVEDRSSNAEMVRLLLLDNLVTASMGGPLAEQADPASLHRVLDVGCGPGGWILEAARLYPHIELVGIDISWRMIEYARAQAQAQRLTDGIEFLVMDATGPLTFPDASPPRTTMPSINGPSVSCNSPMGLSHGLGYDTH